MADAAPKPLSCFFDVLASFRQRGDPYSGTGDARFQEEVCSSQTRVPKAKLAEHGQNVFKSEEENNSSPIKRPFKHETSTSVHPVKKLKVLQYDDVSEKDSDHDEDEDDGCL
ncbi:hypothetical protein NDU88_007288 [Pleurodeles waltl]|uniref:Uncharacterized protein n=1 Tax=Pleurodeles waltl TaxID=8319 RepID=A0AAV7WD21_PLEWA|nr:hypothetical protein NDU88_007288 [Pleurodeles waltl]